MGSSWVRAREKIQYNLAYRQTSKIDLQIAETATSQTLVWPDFSVDPYTGLPTCITSRPATARADDVAVWLRLRFTDLRRWQPRDFSVYNNKATNILSLPNEVCLRASLAAAAGGIVTDAYV